MTFRVTYLLWPPYEIGQAIIFLPCGFYVLSIHLFFIADADIIFLPCSFYILSSFFIPRLISAAADWMSTILPHIVWP